MVKFLILWNIAQFAFWRGTTWYWEKCKLLVQSNYVFAILHRVTIKLSDAHSNVFFAFYHIWSIINVIFIVKSLVGSPFLVSVYISMMIFKSKYVGENDAGNRLKVLEWMMQWWTADHFPDCWYFEVVVKNLKNCWDNHCSNGRRLLPL
jgi:hypothetical protein